MNTEFEEWYSYIDKDNLKKRSIHENMLHAWHMSRMLQPIRYCPKCGDRSDPIHKDWDTPEEEVGNET